MQPIKCDSCIYLGGRYEKGVIHIQSGVLPIEEPYATCLKRQYFVLEREVEKCQDYRNEEGSDKHPAEKDDLPYSFTESHIFACFRENPWLSLDQLTTMLHITEKAQSGYLVLKLKSLLKQKKIATKFASNTLLYSAVI